MFFIYKYKREQKEAGNGLPAENSEANKKISENRKKTEMA
jgi:hypothetical protein